MVLTLLVSVMLVIYKHLFTSVIGLQVILAGTRSLFFLFLLLFLVRNDLRRETRLKSSHHFPNGIFTFTAMIS